MLVYSVPKRRLGARSQRFSRCLSISLPLSAMQRVLINVHCGRVQ